VFASSLTAEHRVGDPPIPQLPPVSSGVDPERLLLYGFEMSLETTSLDLLESVARSVSRESIRSWFSACVGTKEVALLTTCHRVELTLLLSSAHDLEQWRDQLPGPRDAWRVREGRAVVHHLFRVASGRESLASGEAEVRLQVRAAGRRVESRYSRPVLRELFRRAADAAVELAPSVPLSRSIAAVAVAQLLELVRTPLPKVIVIGSGTVGRQVTERLAGEAWVTLVFHAHPPGASFVQATGTRTARLERLSDALADADAVVTAAKFGERGLRATDLPRDRPLLLIDLGMPRNIDPDVRKLSNVRLIDLADLHAQTCRESRSPDSEDRLTDLADRCGEYVERLLMEPVIAALRRSAEELRRNELASARQFLGPLDLRQEQAVERLTRRLVDRILLPSTQQLRSLPPGPEGEARRRWLVELYRPSPADP
jgi:glutamyl-tRNA reductase